MLRTLPCKAHVPKQKPSARQVVYSAIGLVRAEPSIDPAPPRPPPRARVVQPRSLLSIGRLAADFSFGEPRSISSGYARSDSTGLELFKRVAIVAKFWPHLRKGRLDAARDDNRQIIFVRHGVGVVNDRDDFRFAEALPV